MNKEKHKISTYVVGPVRLSRVGYLMPAGTQKPGRGALSRQLTPGHSTARAEYILATSPAEMGAQ